MKKNLGLAWLIEKLNEREIPLNSQKAEYIKQMYLKAVS